MRSFKISNLGTKILFSSVQVWGGGYSGPKNNATALRVYCLFSIGVAKF